PPPIPRPSGPPPPPPSTASPPLSTSTPPPGRPPPSPPARRRRDAARDAALARRQLRGLHLPLAPGLLHPEPRRVRAQARGVPGRSPHLRPQRALRLPGPHARAGPRAPGAAGPGAPAADARQPDRVRQAAGGGGRRGARVPLPARLPALGAVRQRRPRALPAPQ